MSYDEIYNELKSKMTDDAEANEAMLKKEAERFLREKNNVGVEAAGALIMENMSDEKRDEIMRITHIDGVRMDKLYEEINKLVNEGKCIDAKPLAEKLYKKITVEFKETEKIKYVSFRNPFEDNLYQMLFKPEKALHRTPFDFASYITTYAYILIETGSPLDAIPVLKVAMEYNQADCGPKFEMAEVYKLLHNKKRLIEITRETLKVASSPAAIARCYANVGYILTDFHEFEDAVAFYTASIMMFPNPALPHEMQHLADLKGSPVAYVGLEKILEVFEKYDINFGPDKDVVSLAADLASYYLMKNDISNALRALKLTYGLTQDDKIKEMILKYEPESAIGLSSSKNNEKTNITRTVNNNPEE